MSSDRDTTRIVRSWLEAGVTALPDRVLDTVLDQLPATPQRRSWWPTWKFAEMNTYTKLLMAAAAVGIVAVLGYNLLPGRTGVGGPLASASPTPFVSPTPIAALPSGSMSAGTYAETDPTLTLVPYTFTVPVGWTGGDGTLRGDMSGTGVRLTTWIITHVYSNSCHWTGTLVPVADKAALVAAFMAQQGHTRSTPIETAIGGLPATKITFSLDAAFDVNTCDQGAVTRAHIVRLWPDPGPDETGGWLISPGQTTTVYVIEARAQVMVLMTVQHKDSPAADVAALQHILDSVVFHPAS